MKLAIVCKSCDQITWLKIDNLVMKTDRRYGMCDICIVIENESNESLPSSSPLPQQQRTLKDL